MQAILIATNTHRTHTHSHTLTAVIRANLVKAIPNKMNGKKPLERAEKECCLSEYT